MTAGWTTALPRRIVRLPTPPAAWVGIILALTPGTARAQPATSSCRTAVSLPILSGVVLTGDRQRLYATAPDGYLESIAAPNGAVLARDGLWQPLALAGHRLLAWNQVGIGISLEWLDVEATEVRPMGGTIIPLPEWSQGGTAQISATARLTGCTLLVDWRASKRAARGGFGSPTRPDLSAAGWVEVDVEANRFRIAERPPELKESRRSAPYRQGLEWRTAAIDIGQGKTATLRRRTTGSTEELALVVGDGMTEQEMVVGRGADLLAMVSVDARHLFVGDIDRISDGRGQPWAVIDLPMGTALGMVALPADVLSANVSDGRLYYLREAVASSPGMGDLRRRILVAADLRGGGVLWQRVLEEQRGSLLPPQAR